MIEVTNFRKLASLTRFYNYCHWISSRLRDFMQRANYIPHVRGLVRSAVQSPTAHRTTQLGLKLKTRQKLDSKVREIVWPACISLTLF